MGLSHFTFGGTALRVIAYLLKNLRERMGILADECCDPVVLIFTYSMVISHAGSLSAGSSSAFHASYSEDLSNEL